MPTRTASEYWQQCSSVQLFRVSHLASLFCSFHFQCFGSFSFRSSTSLFPPFVLCLYVFPVFFISHNYTVVVLLGLVACFSFSCSRSLSYSSATWPSTRSAGYPTDPKTVSHCAPPNLLGTGVVGRVNKQCLKRCYSSEDPCVCFSFALCWLFCPSVNHVSPVTKT